MTRLAGFYFFVMTEKRRPAMLPSQAPASQAAFDYRLDAE
jgi:hypothetical protein